MAAGSENAPVRAEIIRESNRTRVTRLSLNGRTVVRKEPLGPNAEHRLRHETAMLERLRGIAGIVQLAEAPRYQESIVLADAGAANLTRLAKPLAAVTSGTVDLLGILSASQALSSETSIESLHERVADLLGTMTGATGVHLALWEEDQQDWAPAARDDDGAFPGQYAFSGHDRVCGHDGHRPGAPVSVLRYVQRTREPLLVDDVTRDGRFARDAYFADVATCSMLAVPILSRGDLRAVLLLENRLMRDAFAGGRLDAVALIAGQLTVSLDNTQLYARYRRVAGEQAALRRVATLVAQAAPPQEVFTAVAAEAGRLLGVDVAVLVRYDPPDAFEVAATWLRTNADPPTPVGARLPLGGQDVSSLVYRTGRHP